VVEWWEDRRIGFMATLKQLIGTLTAFALDENIESLATNTAEPLGVVDNSSNDYPTAQLKFIFNLAVTGNTPGGVIELYLITCLATSGTAANWDDQIDPTSASDISSSVKNARLLKVLKADNTMDATDITWNCNDLASLIGGDLPPYWSIVVYNKSGATLAATGHTASYSLVSYQT
jgi:hypothetical protein